MSEIMNQMIQYYYLMIFSAGSVISPYTLDNLSFRARQIQESPNDRRVHRMTAGDKQHGVRGDVS
ncbi:hypothetical protein [Pantoea ananatis]|uniref:hypothetical protein n=1 Tax=Pantoea ananas TaxID=553 RepID=UPI0018905C35|nr:hypothetical protein [Pantoea ananatis]